MKETTSASEQWAAPILALLAALGYVAQLMGYLQALGAKVFFSVVAVFAVGWCVYAFAARKLTKVQPARLVPKYSQAVRTTSAIVAAGSLAIAGYVILPIADTKPEPFFISAEIESFASQRAILREFGKYSLKGPGGRISDEDGGVGRLRVSTTDLTKNGSEYELPSGQSFEFTLEVLNQAQLQSHFASGDRMIEFTLTYQLGPDPNQMPRALHYEALLDETVLAEGVRFQVLAE